MKSSHFKLLDRYKALGTYWWIEIFDSLSPTQEILIRQALINRMHSFEQRYSRFQDNSLLSQLNTYRHLDEVPHEMELLLKRSLEYYFKTEGVFNIATGHVLDAAGYNSQYSFSVSSQLLNSAMQQPAVLLPSCVRLRNRSVTLTKPVQLDFGGFGKGWLIDQLAVLLKEEFGVQEFLINGGGDMYGTSQHGKPITVLLEHPLHSNTATQRSVPRLGSVELYHQALAASSPFKRAWKDTTTQQVYSHLVDTTTQSAKLDNGANTAKVASFVVAHSATDADVYATVASLIGGNRPEVLNRIATAQQVQYLLCSIEGTIMNPYRII